MSSVIVAGNTSGSITLQAPDVAGTTVITLPTASGTMVATDASGNVGIGGVSAGEKLEVVGGIETSGGASSFNRSGLILDYQSGSSTGRIAAGPVAGSTLAFYTANGASISEKMRIDSTGNVGIGATPSARLSLSRAGSANATNFGIGNDTDASGAIIQYVGSTFATTSRREALEFYMTGANTQQIFYTNATERMRIASTGEVLIGTTTTTSGGANLQVSDGITFPATAVASANANTLDDYEEGTFTPTIIGTTTAGTGTYSANSQIGRYTKIGNRVYFTIYLVWTAHTGTGNMRVAGLPFTSIATAGTFNALSTWYQNITMTALNLLKAYNNVNATTVELAQTPVGGGASAVIPMDAAAYLMLTGHYEV